VEGAIPPSTAGRILRLLQDHEIVKLLSEPKGPKPGVFAFSELLNIAEGEEIF
jgi:hypothetical protein